MAEQAKYREDPRRNPRPTPASDIWSMTMVVYVVFFDTDPPKFYPRSHERTKRSRHSIPSANYTEKTCS